MFGNVVILPLFVQFGGLVVQQTIGIVMGANCAPVIADLFLHCYDADPR